jgi:uncharacterized protein involved in exopolysaccharide biosynthesis
MRSLPEVLRVLDRNKRVSAAIFIATIAFVAVAWFIAPRTYVSEARLFVRVGRESVTLDPTATTGQNISVYESRESELSSVVDVIQSRVVVEHVVDGLGPLVVLGRSPLTDAATQIAGRPNSPNHGTRSAMAVPTRLASASVVSPEGNDSASPDQPAPVSSAAQRHSHAGRSGARHTSPEREQAIQLVDRSLSVSHGKKSNVVLIACKGSTPELAQRMVELVLDGFREQHMRINRTQGSFEFFVEQERQSRQQLEEASRTLRDEKNRLGLTSIEGQRKLLQEQMSALETSRLEGESLLASATASTVSLRHALTQLPEKQITQEVSGFPNDARDRSRQQLTDLRLRERELLTRFTELHPQVVAVRRQITEGEQILNRRESPIKQQVNAAHPAHQQLHLKLLEEEARVAALKARITAQTEQMQQLREQLTRLNDNEGQIDMLQKRVDLLQAAHRGYEEKGEQARVDKELETEQISNINIVQPATYMPRPVGPKSMLIFGLGFCVAVCGSLGYPLAREFTRQNWRQPIG